MGHWHPQPPSAASLSLSRRPRRQRSFGLHRRCLHQRARVVAPAIPDLLVELLRQEREPLLAAREQELERAQRGEEEIDFNTPEIKHAREIYNVATSMYSSEVGKRVARREREECELDDVSFAYGEVSFDAICSVITKIKQKFGKEGTGRSPPEVRID